MVSITEGYIKETKKQVSIIERNSGELYTQKPYAKDKEERKNANISNEAKSSK